MEKTLLEIYSEKIEELENIRIPQVKEDIKEETLISLINNKIKSCLPLWVVLARDSEESLEIPTALYCIGTLGVGDRIFYKDANFYIGLVRLDDESPMVVTKVNSSAAIGRRDIIEMLEQAFSSRHTYLHPLNPVVPKGYFLFEFTAQWAAGGQEDTPVEKMEVVQATAFDEAVENLRQLLLFRLGQIIENFFSKFMVVFDSTGWKQLKIKGSRIPDTISRRDLVYKKTTLEIAE